MFPSRKFFTSEHQKQLFFGENIEGISRYMFDTFLFVGLYPKRLQTGLAFLDGHDSVKRKSFMSG